MSFYSQIQQECFEKGAYVVIGGGGAQTSAVANLLNDGWSPLSFRVGLPSENEFWAWKSSCRTGEIVKMGSLADGDDPFWGEGIGPDLRGIMRGYAGRLRMSGHLYPHGDQDTAVSAGNPEAFRYLAGNGASAGSEEGQVD